MNKKAIILAVSLIVGILLIGGYELYSKTNSSANNSNPSGSLGSSNPSGSDPTGVPGADSQQLPQGHPSIDGATGSGTDADTNPSTSSGTNSGATASTPVDGKAVSEKILNALNEKYPGEWAVSGTTLKKGNYTENDSYQMVEEVLKLYPGSMVSIFVGQDRISSSIKGEDGKPVTEGYPTPDEVGQTLKSGEVKVVDAGAIGSSNYQKVYMPLKNGDKAVAVLTISIMQ